MRISRPEISMMLGILIAISSIVGSAAYAVYLKRIDDMLRSDFAAFEAACLAFKKDYGQLPTLYGDYFDFQYGLPQDVNNVEIMNALMSKDGAGNEGYSLNTNKTVYIQVPVAGLLLSGMNKTGEFVDPWGGDYQVVLDTDGNNVCAMEGTSYPPAIGKQVAIWSKGPDGKLYSFDDILGWE
ncbi:MAG: hypothetical protein ACI9TH_001340 [Kiritimatiellia bacterium]|jgi:hypothetical protein